MRRALVLGLAAALALGGCSSGGGGKRGSTIRTNVRSAPPLPEARGEVAGTLWQGRIVVAGGYNDGSQSRNRLDLFDLATGRWARGPDLPAPYEHSSMAVLGDRLYLVGGYLKGGSQGQDLVASDAVYSLGPGGQTWTKEASLLVPRGALATVVVGGSLLAVGGSNDGGVLATTEVYDATARAWRPGPVLREPMEHVAATVVGSTVYAAGRQGGYGTVSTADESLVFPGGQWQEEPDLTVERGGAGAATVDGRPCVAGGDPALSEKGSVECLVGRHWERVAELPKPRHGSVVVAVGRKLHVVGGNSQSGLFVSDEHDVVELAR